MSEHCGCVRVIKHGTDGPYVDIDRTNCKWSEPHEPHMAVPTHPHTVNHDEQQASQDDQCIVCGKRRDEHRAVPQWKCTSVPQVHVHECARLHDHTDKLWHLCECGAVWR